LFYADERWFLATGYDFKSQTLSYIDPHASRQEENRMSVSENFVTVNAEVTNKNLPKPLVKEPVKALVVLKLKQPEPKPEPTLFSPSQSHVKHPKLDYFNSPDAPERGLNKEQLAEVRQMLHDVDNLTAGILKVPEYLGLDTTLDAENACYALDTNFLQIPYWLVGQKHLPPEKVRHLRRALITHEYGHTLFELNAVEKVSLNFCSTKVE
jgi:hypothetical protein